MLIPFLKKKMSLILLILRLYSLGGTLLYSRCVLSRCFPLDSAVRYSHFHLCMGAKSMGTAYVCLYSCWLLLSILRACMRASLCLYKLCICFVISTTEWRTNVLAHYIGLSTVLYSVVCIVYTSRLCSCDVFASTNVRAFMHGLQLVAGFKIHREKAFGTAYSFIYEKKQFLIFNNIFFFRMKNLKIEVEWLGGNRCYEWFTRHILESQNQLFFDVTVDVLQRWTIRSLTLSSFSLRSPSLPSKSNTVYDKRNSETKEKEIS